MGLFKNSGMGSYGRFFMGDFSKNAMTPDAGNLRIMVKAPKKLFLFYDALFKGLLHVPFCGSWRYLEKVHVGDDIPFLVGDIKKRNIYQPLYNLIIDN